MALSVCFYVTAASKGWRLSRSPGGVSGVAGPSAACPSLQRDRLCAVDKRHFCGSCGSQCFLWEGKRQLERRLLGRARSGSGERPWGVAVPGLAWCPQPRVLLWVPRDCSWLKRRRVLPSATFLGSCAHCAQEQWHGVISPALPTGPREEPRVAQDMGALLWPGVSMSAALAQGCLKASFTLTANPW